MDKIYYNYANNRHPLTWMFQQNESSLKNESFEFKNIPTNDILVNIRKWNLVPDNIVNIAFLDYKSIVYFNTSDEPQTIKYLKVGLGQTIYHGSDSYSSNLYSKKILSFEQDIKIIKMFGLNNILYILMRHSSRVSKSYVLKKYNYQTEDMSGGSEDFELKFNDDFNIENTYLEFLVLNSDSQDYVFISNTKKIVYLCLQNLDKGFVNVTEELSFVKDKDPNIVMTLEIIEELSKKNLNKSKVQLNKKHNVLIYDNSSRKFIRISISDIGVRIKEISKYFEKIPNEIVKGLAFINFSSDIVFHDRHNIKHSKQSLLLLFTSETIYSVKNTNGNEMAEIMPLLTIFGKEHIGKTQTNLLKIDLYSNQEKQGINFIYPFNNYGLLLGNISNKELLFLSTSNLKTYTVERESHGQNIIKSES